LPAAFLVACQEQPSAPQASLQQNHPIVADLTNSQPANGRHFAVGGGTALNGDSAMHFAFSAHAGPNGPSGTAELSGTSLYFGAAFDWSLRGHVVCVNVSGNMASIGVAVDQSSGTAAGLAAITMSVGDNGNGRHGADLFYLMAPDGQCQQPPVSAYPISSGNITVK
jgi:hypothetical protein